MNKDILILNDFQQKELYVKIIDSSGNVSQEYYEPSKKVFVKIKLQNLPSGKYTIELSSSKKTRIHKVTLKENSLLASV